MAQQPPYDPSKPYDYASAIETARRARLESDRNYKLKLEEIKNQASQIAISKNQQEATAWYNQQLIVASTAKLAEDKRQFDLTEVEGKRQFEIKNAELTRQFDVTTEAGKQQAAAALAQNAQQYQQTFGESQRQYNAQLTYEASQADQTRAEQQRQFDVTTGQQQKQFDLTTEEGRRQFNESHGLDERTFAEKTREFDLTTAEGIRQFGLTFGLDEKKLNESVRQFDITTEVGKQQFAAKLAEDVRQFDMTSAETKRQFNVSASGYMDDGTATLARDQFETDATGYYNGQSTLERDKFGNSALFDWTSKAIDLASTPADWVKYKQMTSGVSNNIGSIPGLNWTQGGQVGNTAFSGTPEANSLGRVMGHMGVNGGQPAPPNPSGVDPGLTYFKDQMVAGTDPSQSQREWAAMTPEQQGYYRNLAAQRERVRGVDTSTLQGGQPAAAQSPDQAGRLIHDSLGMPIYMPAQGAQDPSRLAGVDTSTLQGATPQPVGFNKGQMASVGGYAMQPGDNRQQYGAAPAAGGDTSRGLDPFMQQQFGGMTPDQVMAARAQNGAAGGDPSAGLTYYMDQLPQGTDPAVASQGWAAMTPVQKANYAQLQAQRDQVRAGGGGVPAQQPAGIPEAQLASTPAAGGGAAQPVTNWAMQAANMIGGGNLNLSSGEQQIYKTADEFSRNPQGAAPGWYEELDPNTRDMLRGAAQAQGHDWTTVMSRMNKSRWGGGGSVGAA